VVSEPLRILAAGSVGWRSPAMVRAVLARCAAGRRDVILIGHYASRGADAMSAAAAHAFGWHASHIRAANWPGPCRPTCPAGHRKLRAGENRSYCPHAGSYLDQDLAAAAPHICLIFLAAGDPARHPLGCAIAAWHAAVPVTFWCDRCGPGSSTPGPCARHATGTTIARWRHATTSPALYALPRPASSWALAAEAMRVLSAGRRRRPPRRAL
jgi:hypothetical protein